MIQQQFCYHYIGNFSIYKIHAIRRCENLIIKAQRLVFKSKRNVEEEAQASRLCRASANGLTAI